MSEYNHHISVLLNETIDSLQIKPDGIYVDMTTGRGGHSSKILEQLNENGRLICFDKDQSAITYCANRFKDDLRVTLVHADFKQLKEKLTQLSISEVDGVIFDLGVSSPQFDDPTRGFSYRFDARLDMRMDQSQSFDAYQIINTYSLDELCRIFREYGEEKFAYPIAKAIIPKRENQPIETTFQLVDVLKSALPAKVLRQKGHPAKKVFQALRIEVNQELEALDLGLNQALECLAVNGICSVITFQSLEDRFVKHLFKKVSTIDMPHGKIPLRQDQLPQPDFELLTKKSIVSSKDELEENNRAHSARLRSIRRIKK